MYHSITVKSVAAERVRLKSDLFAKASNTALIKKAFGGRFRSFRENPACRSIVFVHEKGMSLDEIIANIETLFPLPSVPASRAVCGLEGSCSSCAVKQADTIPWRRKLIEFGLLSGYALYLFVAENILGITIAASPLSLVALVSVAAAVPLLKESARDMKAGRFTLQTFMSGTLLLAVFFGEATAAFEIIYILRGGMLLEEYIATKSKNEIHKLIELDVKKAYLLVDGVEIETDLDDVRPGDILVSRSGEKIPADGVITEGSAEIDEAVINGRSESAFKASGDEVFAGTLCEKGRIAIRVKATGSGTYISRVMRDVERSLAQKSPAELEADRLAARLLKLGTFLTAGTLLLTGSWLNAFSVMIVMSCPCATVLAASTAISGGIANGAKQGILIKGGEALENVSRSDVFCFDKTGTLTTGKPAVIGVYTLKGVDEAELLRCAAAAEYRNSHPIARSIVNHAAGKKIEIGQNGTSDVVPGRGVISTFDGRTILVGNRTFLSENGITTAPLAEAAEAHLERGDTVVFVSADKKVLGIIALRHEVRPGTKEMIESLREKGVKHIALISGDEEKVANGFALDFGFDTVFANQSPYDKAEAVEALKKRYNTVVMVGDGVNDTLAMSRADVAISFAAGGSEAAIAVCDIAVTHSHPEDVVSLYDLSKKSLEVVNQNYWIGTTTNLIGVAFAGAGMLSPVAAGAIHIGHTVGIMANSSRLAVQSGNHKDHERKERQR